MERAQAVANVKAIQQRQDYAKKSDVSRLGSELPAELGELPSDMAALETRLMNRIYAIAIGQAGLIAAFGVFT